jgi:hypothetical protein
MKSMNLDDQRQFLSTYVPIHWGHALAQRWED